MTFLHKLAKRLARFKLLELSALLLAACSQGSVQDYLGPDPNPSKTLVNLSIAPRDPQVAVGDSVRLEATGWFSNGKSEPVAVTWSANGGVVSATGWFRPDGVGEYRVRAIATSKSSVMDSVRVTSVNLIGGIVRLDVLPGLTAVPKGASQQFTAEAVMQDGSRLLPTVAWSATGGTITPSGWFTATGDVGPASVTATLGAGMATGHSDITIQPAILTQLVLNPSTVIMEAGETRTLNVAASWSDGSSTLPPLIWRLQGGSLGGGNQFTAGSAPGTYPLIVSSPMYGKADTTLVWVLPNVVGVSITPGTARLAPGAVQPLHAAALRNDGSENPAGVQWTVSGGSISLDGKFTAGSTPGSYRVIGRLVALNGTVFADTVTITVSGGDAELTNIVITPRSPAVASGDSIQFQPSGTWSDGSTAVPAVTWSANGGSIDSNGVYTAPMSTGSFKVIGRQKGGQRADTAIVAVGPKLLSFRIGPKLDTIVSGSALQYSATLTWSDGLTHPYSISWSTTGGVISSDGRYTPGTLVGNFLVIAVCGCGAADTAGVNVQNSNPPAPPTLSSLVLAPQAVVLALGGMQQFSASGQWSDGTYGPVGVLYEATGGSISSAGFYVAGNTPGTYRVIATQQGGTRADTSVVTISGSPTLTQVVLNPSAVSLVAGATQQFAVTGVWTDGSSTIPSVSYSATGGSVTEGGLYTAGATPGTYQVIASAAGGLPADTAVITIGTSGPTLTQLVMNPSAVSVLPGATQQFAVSASWSDGSSTLPPLTFTATGGTVSAGGLYTAGTAPGSYTVIVRHQGGTKADTSTVTIPQLTQLTLSPGTASVAAGATQLFAVAGTWSNGATTPPAVTYSATGGTISPSGLYTAGGSNGTFQVIARQTGGTLADTSSVTVSGTLPPPPPPPSGGSAPALPAVLNTGYVAPTGNTVNVPAGGNLQTALNNAACGDEILLAPGGTYTGRFVLPQRSCGARPIHVRTSGPLPPEGVRVTPAVAAGFAKLVVTNYEPALAAASRSRGWRIIAVELTTTAANTLNYAMVVIGDGTETSVGDMPGNIVLDRVYVHGNATGHMKRGIQLNGDSTAVIDSWISDFHASGQDAQGIAGWAGPGPYKIVNNHVEGSGENIIFGGADPRISGLNPSDIEIRRNHITKPLSWLNAGYQVKNLLELKNAKRVLVEANVLENNWASAQVGYGIVISVISDNPAITWTTVQDVTLRYNRLRNSASGVHVVAQYHNYETPAARINFSDNLFDDLGAPGLGGEGKLLLLLGGGNAASNDLVFTHNTIMHSQLGGPKGASIILDRYPHNRLTFLDNVISSPSYGLIGVGLYGKPALDRYATNWDFRGNAMVAEQLGSTFPTGNFFPSLSGAGLDAQFRLLSSSSLKGKATDGGDPGANIDLVLQATNGVP